MSTINTKPIGVAQGELIDEGIILNRSKQIKQIYLNSEDNSKTVLYRSKGALNTNNFDIKYSKSENDNDIDIELKNTENQNVVGNIKIPKSIHVSVGKDYQNKMLWSNDGKSWNGSTSIFTSNAYSVATNGTLWIACGEGTDNTLAYSYDGYTWEGMGKSVFTQEAVGIGFYNNIWVAVGKSTNSIAYSLNGFEWTGLGMRFSNAGLCLKHNGSRWLAGGDSIGNTFAYSDDGINWTTVDCSLNVVRDIAYSDSIIIAVGDRTNTSWQLVSNTMTNWNGSFEDDDLSSYITSSSGFKKLGDDGPATLTGWTFTTGTHATYGPTLFRGNTYNSSDPPLQGQQIIGLRYSQELSKTISNLIMGKVYKLSWERHIRQDDQPEYCILLDSNPTPIFSEIPSTPIGASTSAERLKEVSFVATSTSHTITFKHLAGSDKTVYIDNVELYRDLDTISNISYSQDNGVTWTSTLIDNLKNINGIGNSTNTWVAVGEPNSLTSARMIYSQDVLGISNWTDISNSLLSSVGNKVIWNGQKFIIAGEGNTNTVLISDDGINWTGKGKSVLSSGANQISYDGTKLVTGGSIDSSGNTMFYSLDDGVNWYPLNSTTGIFSTQANDVAYDGTNWLVVGEGVTNTMAISKDGKKWKGLGKHTFSLRGNSVYFDEKTKKWVALGEGTNTIAYSYNSYLWTGLGTSIFSVAGKKTASNGNIWVAVGEGTNTIAYSYDGIEWTGLGTSIFSVRGNDVVWSGLTWNVVGEGTNTIAYSYDGINWETNVTNDSLVNKVNTIEYFNNLWVAGGDGVSGTQSSSAINPEGTWNTIGTVLQSERIGDQLGNSLSLSGNGSVLAVASNYNDPPIGGVETGIMKSINPLIGTGTSGYSGDGGLATEAQINVWIRAFGFFDNCLYFGDLDNNRVRKVDLSTNIITTVAGIGSNSYSGDGGLAIDAAIGRPEGFGIDKFGNMFIASNGGGGSYKMRKVDVNTGIIDLYCGDGTAGNSGDGGLPINARIGFTYQIDFDSQNNMYFPSYNHNHVRRIDYQTQIVSTIMTGVSIVVDLAIDLSDNVYAAGMTAQKIYKWDKDTGVQSVVAGSGGQTTTQGLQDPSIGDGGDALSAKFRYPCGVAVDTNGDIYISDANNCRIRKVDKATNIISTVVGDGFGATNSGGTNGEISGNGGDPANARVKNPQNLAFDNNGLLYIADSATVRTVYLTETNISNAGHVRVFDNSSGSWNQIGSDIDGIAENDYTGTSVSLSDDGTTVAVSAIGHSGTGLNGNGCVRVYENQSNNWVKIGSDIEGTSTNDNFGASVAISQDGSIVVIGATNYQSGNQGYAKVYKNNSGTWTQIGDTIVGSGASDRLGNSVSISLDGSIIAIGIKSSTTANGTESGEVKIYQDVSGTWTQLGNSILGDDSNYNFGYSVSLSGNGQLISVGAYNADYMDTNSGQVTVYEYVSGTNTWNKLGNDIYGYESNEQFGSAVMISKDGSTIVSGSWNSDIGGTDTGYVKVFKFLDGYWKQIGRKIIGENSSDKLGFAVSINTDGSIIAVGSIGFNNNSGNASTYQIQNAFSGEDVGIGHTLAYSRNGIDWTGLNAEIFSIQTNRVYHNGLFWIACGEGSNTLAYSTNGTTWNILKDNVFSDTAMSVISNKNTANLDLNSKILAFGQGTNTIAKSNDGINWTGAGASVFTQYAKNGFWNGSLWVVVGKGTNTLATSTDGETWNGLGTSVFSLHGNDVLYGGNIWVAVGNGINKFAYSLDGITWTKNSNTIFLSEGNKVAYNGSLWVAVGKGGNTIATSTDGINWTGRGKTIFTSEGNGIVWTGFKWIATGSGTNTIAYSSDGINWTGIGNTIFSLKGNGLSYNSELIVATGQGSNTIACSIDGINWIPLGVDTFSQEGKNIDWDGTYWIASGIGSSNTLAYSTNGFSWTGIGKTIFTTQGNGISSNNPLIYNSISKQIHEKQIEFSTGSTFEGDVSIKIEK